MFGVVPKTIWNRTTPADQNNLCTFAMRSLLIEDGDRLILVDTGIGNKQSEKFLAYYYLHGDDSLEKSLAARGFSKDDITDVFLTHLHLDHVGGAIERKGENLIPAFKNASYWSNQQHWDWAVFPNEREKASFLRENIIPIQESGQLKFLSPQQSDLTDNVSVRFTYGHTDAMMLPQVTYKGKTILYAADLIPTAAHIPVLYVAGYDVFPLKSMDEKKEILNEALANEYILFLEHDAINECCTLIQTEKGIRLGETFSVSDI